MKSSDVLEAPGGNGLFRVSNNQTGWIYLWASNPRKKPHMKQEGTDFGIKSGFFIKQLPRGYKLVGFDPSEGVLRCNDATRQRVAGKIRTGDQNWAAQWPGPCRGSRVCGLATWMAAGRHCGRVWDPTLDQTEQLPGWWLCGSRLVRHGGFLEKPKIHGSPTTGPVG